MSLPPGIRLGPYEILTPLGAGGMGEVYLAEDTRLGRKVALKCLSEASLGAAVMRRRLLREARAAATLNHPNIAAVYDVLEEEERAYIVMEYVEGETLAARLRRGRMSLEQALEVGVQVASALVAAHSRGVVHHDLKPANIHLTRDGQVKILDFGLARTRPVETARSRADGEHREAPTSQAGQFAGTPGYAAPEVLLGKAADHRADIYGLGVVLFEMLTGRRPVEAEDFVGQVLGTFAGRIPTPADVDPTVPSAISAVVARALVREPSDRYQLAAELRAELTRLVAALDGRQATVAADVEGSAARRLEHETALRRWRPGPVLVLVTVVLLATAIPIVRWSQSPKTASVVSTKPPVVAVLPFANLSGDPSKDYLGVGIAESLTINLARMPTVTVVPRSAAVESRARTASIARIARDLGASFLVDGGIQQSGDRLKVTVKLVRPDGSLAWAEAYDGLLLDLFGLQSRLAEGLTPALQVTLTVADRQRFARSPSHNAEALADYWRGRALLERADVKGNISRAIGSFQRALEKDSRFALAYAGLGEAYWAQYQETREPEWTRKALEASHEALRLDPEQAHVRIALARVYQGTGRRDAAVEELQRALLLQPNNDDAHRLLGEILAEQGRMNDAVSEFQRAIAPRPNFWGNYDALGLALYRAGRYAGAADAFRRVTELQPDNAEGFHRLGTAYHMMDDLRQARENYEKALRLGSAKTYSNIGTIYYREGRFADAARAYEEALQLGPSLPLRHRNLGDAYRRLGRHDDARAAYLRGVELSRTMLRVNPEDARTLALLAVLEAKLGRYDAAQTHAEEAVALRPTDGDGLYKKAVVRALAGHTQEALAALELALRHGYSVTEARHDDELNTIRRLPQFKRLVEQKR